MSPLTGRTPTEAFETFREHLGKLLNRTITDARLSVIEVGGGERGLLSFRRNEDVIAAPLRSKGLFLYIGQVVAVEKNESNAWRLRTLQYRYWIQGEDNERTKSWFFRFEYVSPNVRPSLHPRHHLHLPCDLKCGREILKLREIHISTGWVTIEEVIRFTINELGVKSKDKNWNQLLVDSEEQFREWTSRTV